MVDIASGSIDAPSLQSIYRLIESNVAIISGFIDKYCILSSAMRTV